MSAPAQPFPRKPTRNQARASDPSASAWVSANAGTGKTEVLVKRVLRLLLAGSKPESHPLPHLHQDGGGRDGRTACSRTSPPWATIDDDELAQDARRARRSARRTSGELRTGAAPLRARRSNAKGGLKIHDHPRLLRAAAAALSARGARSTPHFAVLDERGQARAPAEALRCRAGARRRATATARSARRSRRVIDDRERVRFPHGHRCRAQPSAPRSSAWSPITTGGDRLGRGRARALRHALGRRRERRRSGADRGDADDVSRRRDRRRCSMRSRLTARPATTERVERAWYAAEARGRRSRASRRCEPIFLHRAEHEPRQEPLQQGGRESPRADALSRRSRRRASGFVPLELVLAQAARRRGERRGAASSPTR